MDENDRKRTEAGLRKKKAQRDRDRARLIKIGDAVGVFVPERLYVKMMLATKKYDDQWDFIGLTPNEKKEAVAAWLQQLANAELGLPTGVQSMTEQDWIEFSSALAKTENKRRR